jgi:autotransporter-associated beta strand protein
MKPPFSSNEPLRIRPNLATLLATATLAGTFQAGAAPIAVPNPSFEARAITDGQDVFNSSGTDSWRHWQRTENGGPCRILNPGVSGTLRPNTLSSYVYAFEGVAPAGNHLLVVRSRYSDVALTVPPQWDGINYFSAGVVLLDGIAEPAPALPSAPFDSTKVYKLTATVGKPIVFQTMPAQGSPVFSTDPRVPQDQVWFGYALQLAVGGTKVNPGAFANAINGGVVVTQDANTFSIPVDSFRTVTTTYFPNPADAGLVGPTQFLQLRLAALDNPANLAQTGHVAYDDIKLEEFAAPALAYWDLNDTAAGAGGIAPTGTWDGSNRWNAAADGTGTAVAWTPGQAAVFSAGGDATGPYTITVSGTRNIGGLTFENGNVTLTGGTALELAGIGMIDVATGLTATVETPITQASAGLEIAKTGTGTLVLSGANSYSGGTTVLDGTLRLGASNVLADSSRVTVIGRSAGITTFDLNGNSDTVGGLVLGGSTASSAAVVSTGAGTLTLGGDVAYVNAGGSGGNPLGATISGNLSLGAAARTFVVNNSTTSAADLTVSAAISGVGAMTKEGRGILVLSGNNAGATGGLILTEGIIQAESLASLNGTGADVTLTAPGALVFGPSFGAANIPTALSTRILESSNGVIAADNYAANNFDFGTANLNTYLGAVSDVSYTGTLTPAGTIYRLGGGGGTLTMANTNALTGSGKSAIIGGLVSLAGSNDYDGGTTLPSGTVVLTIGSSSSIGTGPLTFAGGTLQGADATARTVANPIVATGTVRIGGPGDFTFSNTAASDLVANRTFVIDNPSTTFAQNFIGAASGITKSGTGTMVLTGNNTHGGGVNLTAGTLLVNSATAFGTGTVTLTAGTIDVPTGPITVPTNNPVTIAGSFTFGGTNNLTFGAGAVSSSGNPTITLNGTNSTLTFGGVLTNTLANNQTTTVNGPGNTLVVGGYALSNSATSRTPTITGTSNVRITGGVTNGGTATSSGLTKSGTGTLTLQGINTYSGATTVNAGGCLALIGGSQNSAISVANLAFLGLSPGSPTTSTKNLTLAVGSKIRITGTPTQSSYALFTTTGTITGIPVLETDISGYEIVNEGTVLRLKVKPTIDYLNWAAGFAPADLSNPTADFDGDGLVNNDERIFGLNPTLGSSANPISVPLDTSAGTFSFTRRDPALSGQLFSVWTSTSLLAWSRDEGAVLTPGALVDGIETVAVQLSPSLLTAPRLFVRVRAESAPPPPPLLDEDFEADNGDFIVVTTGGTPWDYGDPESVSVGGGAVLTGNGGSAKCWGTNLTGTIVASTDTSLRSPMIDLTGIPGGCTLSFALALDSDTGNTIEVNAVDPATGAVIANLLPPTQDGSTTALWEQLVVAIPNLNRQVRLEWRFKGLSFDFPVLGAYIDDVKVIKNP